MRENDPFCSLNFRFLVFRSDELPRQARDNENEKLNK